MCPVPIGVEGVLWIGGIGLARGYLKHPKLSSSVFRPNPFEGGEEVYCSGDVARWDEDGSIRILGRKDEQVKVNGIRVELEGIESALLTHPRVLKAGVTCALNAKAAVSHFVAFCTARSGGGPAESLADIKAYLGTRLAPYAIPQALHWIESLPLSPNGKLDRKALSVLYKEKYAQKNKVGLGFCCISRPI
jgi:acyl-coenzyme A synthetase/AMP-(fatty) acid ligase